MSAIESVDHHEPSTLIDPDQRSAPPPQPPPVPSHDPWPGSARIVVAVLAVLTLLGATIATIAFAASGDDGTADDSAPALQRRLDAAEAERDDALARAEELDAESALLRSRLGGVEAERDELTDRLADAVDDRDDVRSALAELDGRIAAITADLELATSERDAAAAQAARLEEVVALARQQAVDAVAERDAIANRFPVTITPTFDTGDVTGTYGLTWREQFCAGLSTCGTVPIVRSATVRTTPEGYLRVELGGLVTTNLARVGSGLHAVADSATAVPACGGTARVARLTITAMPLRLVVDDDGSVEIASWSAAVTIEAPATATCSAVLAVYGVDLAPR